MTAHSFENYEKCATPLVPPENIFNYDKTNLTDDPESRAYFLYSEIQYREMSHVYDCSKHDVKKPQGKPLVSHWQLW